MAVIFQRDFPNTAGKTGLRLGNEEFIRPLSIGSGWTRIRVSITCAIQGDGQSFAGGTFFMGLIQGTQFGFNSPSCIGAFGVGSNAATYTFNASSGNPYYSASMSACRKTGATATYVSTATSYIPTTTGTLRRSILTAGITKDPASTNWTDYFYTPQSAGVSNYDARFYDHVNSSEAGYTVATWFANATQYDLSQALAVTNTFTEPAGGLDALSIYWNKSNYPLEIYSITVTRYV